MTVMTAPNLRSLVLRASENNIPKEDVVGILKEDGQYMLVYYK